VVNQSLVLRINPANAAWGQSSRSKKTFKRDFLISMLAKMLLSAKINA
jgi:hypothetical protein